MSTEIKLMTDTEMKILKMHLYANPTTMVDPEVVRRLLATAESYKDAVDQVPAWCRWVLPQAVL